MLGNMKTPKTKCNTKNKSFHISSKLTLCFSSVKEELPTRKFNSCINEISGDSFTLGENPDYDFTFRNKSNPNSVNNIEEKKTKAESKNIAISKISINDYEYDNLIVKNPSNKIPIEYNSSDNKRKLSTIKVSRNSNARKSNSSLISSESTLDEENKSLNLFINLNSDGLYFFKDTAISNIKYRVPTIQ